MFKSVLVVIFVVIVLFIARSIMQRLKDPSKERVISSNDTLQCQHCKTYVPREDAVINGGKAFCSTQHLNDWNQSS